MSDDIVARLREEGFITHMAQLPRESKILHSAADEIERLRKERDEARREVCAYVSGHYRKDVVTLDRAATLEEAKLRGWDCFKEQR